MIKQLADSHEAPSIESVRNTIWEQRPGRGKDSARANGVMLSSGADQKPLTKREREVLRLISEGHSNKEGALRMNISPRTFESHRAEAMRKLEHLSSRDREAIEHFSRSLMNKFLHEPSVRLRAAAANGRGLGVVDALRYLFDLRASDASAKSDAADSPSAKEG